MTDNKWAEPDGYIDRPPRIKYTIKDRATGAIVLRLTSVTPDGAVRGGRYFHSLASDDLHLGKLVASLQQQACGYFSKRDCPSAHDSQQCVHHSICYVPLEGVPDIVISDDEVRARIERMDLGENSREAERVRADRYPFQDLPWDQQRALVEQIEALKREWHFKILGEASDEEEKSWEMAQYVRVIDTNPPA